MATAAIEKWSERTFTKAPRGWTAQRVFQIQDADGEDDALSAAGLPAENSAHPEDSRLKVDGLTAESPGGMRFWLVRVSYSQPENGDSHSGPGDGDPTLAPVEYEWSNSIVSLPVDRDVEGHPIVNSAGTPMPGAQREFYQWSFTAIRVESYFNFAVARAFQGKVNSAAITVAGYVFPIGSLRCMSILPASRFTADSTTIPIAYRFEFREYESYVATPSVAESPFQLYLTDQGYGGWYNDGADKKGKFADDAGTEVSEPVLLNGSGVPITTGKFFVLGGVPPTKKTPTSAPVAERATFAGHISIGSASVILIYKNYAGASFAALGL